MDSPKLKACEHVDLIRGDLIAVSDEIHRHPEVKFEERFASALLAKKLRDAGFSVEHGAGGLDTAIRAEHPAESDGPTVAILAEYDALPGLGHGCGHNLIAAGALGASLAVGMVKDGLPGKLVFMGTPGEEIGGGKAMMIEAGLFDDIDAAMMFHPGRFTYVDRGSLALAEAKFEFTGKPAHASGTPEMGINALDAVIQTFNGINALRQHIRDRARLHGIITNGGAQPNIVPESAAAHFYLRAPDAAYRDELIEKLRHCAEGAGLATGATLRFEVVGYPYEPLKQNRAMGEAFTRNLESLGERITPASPGGGLGSTDMGNVSQVLPSLHLHIAICDRDMAGHSREFAEAAASPRGQEGMLLGAKGLAMTTIDLLTDPALMQRVRSEFENDGREE